jgi:hypothetical protein
MFRLSVGGPRDLDSLDVLFGHQDAFDGTGQLCLTFWHKKDPREVWIACCLHNIEPDGDGATE